MSLNKLCSCVNYTIPNTQQIILAVFRKIQMCECGLECFRKFWFWVTQLSWLLVSARNRLCSHSIKIQSLVAFWNSVYAWSGLCHFVRLVRMINFWRRVENYEAEARNFQSYQGWKSQICDQGKDKYVIREKTNKFSNVWFLLMQLSTANSQNFEPHVADLEVQSFLLLFLEQY